MNFNYVPSKKCGSIECSGPSIGRFGDQEFIRIEGTACDIESAKQLRDWLIAVLPAFIDSPADGEVKP